MGLTDPNKLTEELAAGFKKQQKEKSLSKKYVAYDDASEQRKKRIEERDDRKQERYAASKARLEELLSVSQFTIITHKDGKGKFGRILGEPEVDHPQYGKINVCDRMIEEGHARSYYGSTKVPWV